MSIRAYYFNIFPSQSLGKSIHYEFWYLHEMKACLYNESLLLAVPFSVTSDDVPNFQNKPCPYTGGYYF